MTSTVRGVDNFTTEAAARGFIRLDTSAGFGSINTAIRRFTNILSNVGSDITLVQSATLGDSFQINANGMYAITYMDNLPNANDLGLSINSSQLTTSIAAITAANRLANTTTPTGSGFRALVAWTGFLAAGDVIRAHNAVSVASSGPALCNFTIARVA